MKRREKKGLFILLIVVLALSAGCRHSDAKTVTLKHGDVYVLKEDANFLYSFLRMEPDERYSSAYALDDLSKYDEEEYITPDFINGVPVTVISDERDFDSPKLKRMVLGNNVRYLGCIHIENLQSIEIGANVSLIMSPAFLDCFSLKSVTIDERNPCYYSENNAIIETATKTIVSVCGGMTEVPSSAVSIGAYSFTGTEFVTLCVPSNITEIGKGAFQQCRRLEALYLPDSVTTVGNDIFTDINQNRKIDVFCEAAAKPDGWSDEWYYIFSKGPDDEHDDTYYKELNDRFVTVHWGASIEEYDDFVRLQKP